MTGMRTRVAAFQMIEGRQPDAEDLLHLCVDAIVGIERELETINRKIEETNESLRRFQNKYSRG